MKYIKVFEAAKYKADKTGKIFKKPLYKKVADGIYQMQDDEKLFVMSLSFEQEPELGEGKGTADISQYPLEDILDKYFCQISDFYEERNAAGSKVCFLEFASEDMNNILELKEIVGKHVYNKAVERDGQVFDELIIE